MMRLAVLMWLLASSAATAHSPPAQGPRRAPPEIPNLEGVWTNTAATPLERPPGFKSLIATEAEAASFEKMIAGMVAAAAMPSGADGVPPKVKAVGNSEWVEMDMHLARIAGRPRSSWITDPPDGKAPFTPVGAAARAAADKESFDNPEDRPLPEQCLTGIGSPEGPPMLNTGYNGNYEIVQTPDHVAILIEMIHDVRVIRLRSRRHLPESIRPWMGDSVGWYEGKTLVVETTNFNPRTVVSSLTGSFTYSPKAKLLERFTRTSDHGLLYEFEVIDPTNFTRPWKGEMPWRTAKGPIYEYACHEGNYSLPLALSGARRVGER